MKTSPLHSPHSPLLLVDAGNTRLKFGQVASGPSEERLPDCAHVVAVRANEPIPWDVMRTWETADSAPPRGVITGSNPGQIERVVDDWPADWSQPRVITDRNELPISIDVDEPQRVGMDRLLNAIATNRLRKPGEPAIVIDVGTATTVDAVSREGAFVGGAILAGPELTARALNEYTAVLPYVTLEELNATEPPVIGRNTQDAIRSGLYWGHWQSVWSYCVRMMEPLGASHAPQTILTGGAAGLFTGRLSPAHVYLPNLTLQGLAVAAQSADNAPDPTEQG